MKLEARLRVLVACPVLPGKATLPAESCALRHLARHENGNLHGRPKCPMCAQCERGGAEVAKLERAGWKRPKRIQRSARDLAAQNAARRMWVLSRLHGEQAFR